MKALVTGASGAIGQHLVRRLCEAGYAVRALVRPVSNVGEWNIADVELVQGDIRDAAAIERATIGCTHVYHLAAITSRRNASRHEYEAVNVRGTENIVRAAIRAGVQRFVYAGSAGIHASNPRHTISEDDPPRPTSHYRRTKHAAEQLVLSHHRGHGLPAVVARLSSVYGPGMLNWLGLFRAVGTGRFRLIGRGENRRHMGFISDIVDGLLRCGETQGIIGQTYIITGSEPVTVKYLVETIADEMSIREPIRSIPDWPHRAYHHLCRRIFERFNIELLYAQRYNLFFEHHVFDTTKSRNELGYKPAVSPRDGIRQTLAWYRAHGYLR